MSIAIAALLSGLSATSARPMVNFSVPSLAGSSNASHPDGSKFWFPSISISTGIKGHVAQHVTLSGDGGGGCQFAGTARQACEQIIFTRDGGLTWKVTKKIRNGTSGNFNGYGDLGSWVPPRKGAQTPPGQFQAIVGCNNCFSKGGGSLVQPAYLQTWQDDGITLSLQKSVPIAYRDTPAAFTGMCKYGGGAPCGFSTPDQSIVRTADGGLLMALYGYAADGYKNGSLYTTAFYSSSDGGMTWSFASRVDVTPAMVSAGAGEGPCEPTMATLADGRVLAAFRLQGGRPLWLAYSSDNGKSWTDPAAAKGEKAVGSPGSVDAVYAVWPQLLLLSNGALVLASGRPGIGFWVSPDADGASWIGCDVEQGRTFDEPCDALMICDCMRARVSQVRRRGRAFEEPSIRPVGRRARDGHDQLHWDRGGGTRGGDARLRQE